MTAATAYGTPLHLLHTDTIDLSVRQNCFIDTFPYMYTSVSIKIKQFCRTLEQLLSIYLCILIFIHSVDGFYYAADVGHLSRRWFIQFRLNMLICIEIVVHEWSCLFQFIRVVAVVSGIWNKCHYMASATNFPQSMAAFTAIFDYWIWPSPLLINQYVDYVLVRFTKSWIHRRSQKDRVLNFLQPDNFTKSRMCYSRHTRKYCELSGLSLKRFCAIRVALGDLVSAECNPFEISFFNCW